LTPAKRNRAPSREHRRGPADEASGGGADLGRSCGSEG
jgi:hypothetical protein